MFEPLLAAGQPLPLITTVAMTLTAAWVLGLITQRIGLSPIVGYLLAGILVGPHTPGFVAKVELAHELSEIGVILLMFGVGLHFHLADLLKVRRVALPGAVGQSLVATALGVAVAIAFGMTFKTGIALGIALSVASTVVLIRVLTDNRLLDSQHGHVAVGWLIVEDILTVIVLVLIPAMGTDPGAEGPPTSIWISLPLALLKLSVFVAIMLVVGAKLIPRLMIVVARFRSRELFTLTVLVMAIAIATGAYYAFGASMALGAFLAGMVVGQSAVSHQAGADILPLRDAFAVLFFASVGMLFDPMFVVHDPLLLIAAASVVLIGKPLAAMLIVAVIGYPLRTAMVVAIGLAQIGEFSFIVCSLAKSYGLLDIEGRVYNVVVAAAIVSITLNPMLMKLLPSLERTIKLWPALYRWMNRGEKGGLSNAAALEAMENEEPITVVLGYGPVGRTVDGLLRERGVKTLIVEQNMNTVERLTREGRAAIYGDAFNIEVLAQAVAKATHLIVTLPHSANRNPLISSAKLLNPELNVIVRARYMQESDELRQVGADHVRYEEIEIAVALSRIVLHERGENPETIDREVTRVRQELRIATA
jgi:CPA2 family monovalent cation:H+ antiporter-2